MSEQNIPHSLDAEEAVLGALMMSRRAIGEVDFLKPSDFFFLRNQYVYTAILELAAENEPTDYVTLVSRLEAKQQLAAVGGASFITQLINNTPSSMHASVYGALVHRAAIRRAGMNAVGDLMALFRDETLAIDEVIEQAQARLADALTTREREQNDFGDQLQFTLDDIEAAWNNPNAGRVPFGLRDLDALTGGVENGELVYLGGRPGMGKSTLLLRFILNAVQFKYRVALWTGEMSYKQWIIRALSQLIGIPYKLIARGTMPVHRREQLMEAANDLYEMGKDHIVIIDRPRLTPQGLRNEMRRIGKVDAVYLDYIQIMAADTREDNRYAKFSDISQALKEVARTYDIPLVAAAQLSRALENRADKRPMLSDLKETGALEQDADMVLFVYRDEVYNPMTEFPNQAEIIVAKNRNGETGAARVYFDKATMKFMDGQSRTVDLGGGDDD